MQLLSFAMLKLIMVLVFAIAFFNHKIPAYAWCDYRDTQARVQKNTQDPWKTDLNISVGEMFNVGSFHDGTGQFAQDTRLIVIDPYGWKCAYSNGQSIFASTPGTYWLRVETINQDGLSCTEEARVYVSYANPVYSSPTPSSTVTPSPVMTSPDQCYYQSTQSRVQKNISSAWGTTEVIVEGESFNVGSFHNDTGQFANDTTIEVTFPDGRTQTYSNGQTVYASACGTYKVKVTTNSQSGSGCSQISTVQVNRRPISLPSITWARATDYWQQRYQRLREYIQYYRHNHQLPDWDYNL
jgi:hypothetical protein